MAVGKVAMAHGKSAGVICPHAGVWAFTLKNHSLHSHSLPPNASSIFPAKPKPTVVMDGSVVFGHAQCETMGNPSNQWPTNGIPRPFLSPNLSTVIEVGELLNHSMFVKLPSQIALFLVKFHAKYTGRTDLRERRRNGFAITAFDCVVFTNSIQPWFEARLDGLTA